MIFDKNDYFEIREIAWQLYMDKPYSSPDDREHLAKCYADATLAYLKRKGYTVVKENSGC